MTATTTNTETRIYVACLASYNAGTLHGEWIDVDQDEALVQAEIVAMLEASPEPDAEEFAIHDYEGFGSYDVGEYESISDLCALAGLIGEHGTIIADYMGHIGCTIADVEASFQDQYIGCYDSEQAYAEELIDDCYGLEGKMGNLACYFDYEAFTRDLFMCDNFSISNDDGCHVFHN